VRFTLQTATDFYWQDQIKVCRILDPYSGGYEELCLLGYNVALLAICFHSAFLLGLLRYPEDVSDMLLRNMD
jgi:hypothetical protein